MTPWLRAVGDAGTIGHWRLSGEATGAIAGDTDGALRLDGNEHHLLDAERFGGRVITVEVWMREGRGAVLSYATAEHPEAFHIVHDDSLRLTMFGEVRDTGVAVPNEGWHQVAVSWRAEGGHVAAYLDGELAWEGTLAEGEELPRGGRLELGQVQGCMGGCFLLGYAGELDELILSDQPIDPGHVAARAGFRRPDGEPGAGRGG